MATKAPEAHPRSRSSPLAKSTSAACRLRIRRASDLSNKWWKIFTSCKISPHKSSETSTSKTFRVTSSKWRISKAWSSSRIKVKLTFLTKELQPIWVEMAVKIFTWTILRFKISWLMDNSAITATDPFRWPTRASNTLHMTNLACSHEESMEARMKIVRAVQSMEMRSIVRAAAVQMRKLMSRVIGRLTGSKEDSKGLTRCSKKERWGPTFLKIGSQNLERSSESSLLKTVHLHPHQHRLTEGNRKSLAKVKQLIVDQGVALLNVKPTSDHLSNDSFDTSALGSII